MLQRMVIVAAVVLGVGVAAVAQETPADKRQALLKEVEQSLRSGDRLKAAQTHLAIAAIDGLDDGSRGMALWNAAGLLKSLDKPEEARAALAGIVALKNPRGQELGAAVASLVEEDLRAKRVDEALARIEQTLARPTAAIRPGLLMRKAAILEKQKADPAGAEAAYRQAVDLKASGALAELIRLRRAAKADDQEMFGLYSSRVADRNILFAGCDYFAAKGDGGRRDDLLIAYLSICNAATPDGGVLARIVPPGSSTRLWFDSAQAVLTAYRAGLVAREGRLQVDPLQALADQLTRGGDARILSIGDAEKAFAARLESAKDFALRDWYAAMFAGKYAKAARIAFQFSKAAGNDQAFAQWVQAAAAAVRCLDQCYNGRAMGYVKWVNGDKTVAANPIADLLEGKE